MSTHIYHEVRMSGCVPGGRMESRVRIRGLGYCGNARCGLSLFFFFSSRRRHTRCGRDWSSDVCSSDLDSRLPDVTLKKVWREPIAAELEDHGGLILDLRSEAYAALGPAPVGGNSYFLRVVAEGADGKKRALNHFNKKGKGEFVRTLLESRIDHADAASLLDWAAEFGIELSPGVAGELELTVANSLVGSSVKAR